MPSDLFEGRRVLVTGAGGSIGSELARSLAGLGVEALVLLDNDEYGLSATERELRMARLSRCECYTGDVCDGRLLNRVFERHRPDVVFHAAALKHVPDLERNPFAAVQVNILGTWKVIEAAAQHGAEQLILLSTDKAVDPISIMGATKRVAELMVLANRTPTRMKAVRLCNVIGSSGSVAPLFMAQIAHREMLTITHSEATRLFVSLSNAVHLLLCAAGRNFATGLAVPRVAVAKKIEDLACFLMERVAGFVAHEDARARIVCIGLRPGDKLHEAMVSGRERIVLNGRSNTSALTDVWTPTLTAEQLKAHVHQVGVALENRRLGDLLWLMREVVPEYEPTEVLMSRLEEVRQDT